MKGRPPDDAEQAAWLQAMELWGVQVHAPEMVSGANQGTFAWFSFPPSVHVDVDELASKGARDHLVSVFAHEIGHHVLSPSTRIGSFKLLQQMARAITACDPRQLIPVTKTASRLSNLWSDMLINERVARMQRRVRPDVEPDMIALWRRLTAGPPGSSAVWWVVMRAYEMLWSLPADTLCAKDPPPGPAAAVQAARDRQIVDPGALDVSDVSEALRDKERAHRAAAQRLRAVEDELILSQPIRPEVDAGFVADAVRTFGADPVSGALRFGMVLVPYLVIEAKTSGGGPPPDGLTGGGCVEQAGQAPTASELAEVLADPRLTERTVHPAAVKVEDVGGQEPQDGQAYGIAKTLALFAGADPLAVLLAWYESEARRWIKPLTQLGRPPAADAIPGPLATWELGDDLADLDWPASLAAGLVVPGVTTRRRTELPDDPTETRDWVSLDLYVDSSGSMPSPSQGSPAVLAGTILALSVLKGGGRVRVTSWSGAGQVAGGSVFTRDRLEIMRELTTFFRGGTTFPLDLLASRYPLGDCGRTGERRHLVVLSDDGLASLFGEGQEQYAGVAAEVRRVLDTATLLVQDRTRSMAKPAAEAGYDVDYLDDMASAPGVCAALAARIVGGRDREVLGG